jgi:hypothetical protein
MAARRQHVLGAGFRIRRISMTKRHRSWRPGLSADMSVGAAGIGPRVPDRGAQSSFPLPAGPAATAGKPKLARGRSAVVPGDPEAGLILPAWRNLLEARWQQRLATVISRSVAYHDAAERSGGGYGAGAQAETQALQQLMQRVATRYV